MCITDHHDITLAVKVVINPNATNQPIVYSALTFYSTDTHFDASTLDRLLKKLWEKEELLIMSNFSISHNVFYSIR